MTLVDIEQLPPDDRAAIQAMVEAAYRKATELRANLNDEAPSNAARCEGCAELRDQLRDLARKSNLDAMRVGKLAEDVERYSALHARLFAEKTAAQIELEELREALFRLWPAVEKAMAGLVFTADRAGEIAADMSAIRAAIAPEEPASES